MKLDEAGNIWITTFSSGGIDIVSKDGAFIDFLHTGGVPMNCMFDGDTLLVTDLGDSADVGAEAAMTGRLWRVDVGVRGAPVARGAIVCKEV
jgi:gluconolactonase